MRSAAFRRSSAEGQSPLTTTFWSGRIFHAAGFFWMIPNPMGLVGIIQKNPAAWKIRPDQKIVVKGDWPSAEDRLKAAERMTAALAKVATA